MEFHVPQFIDFEDKVIGPFTWKQFLFLLGGGGTGYAAYVIIHFFPFNLLVGLAFAGLGLTLAFYPKEKFGRPFAEVLESAVKYYFRGKLYTWKKAPKAPSAAQPFNTLHKRAPLLSVPGVSHGKLSNASWSLEVGKRSEN